MECRYRLPVGAELLPGGAETRFRVWAPQERKVEIMFGDSSDSESARAVQLPSEGNGYFSGHAMAVAGTLYRYRLDGRPRLYSDPASRFQPQGPLGPSQVVDPNRFP